MPVRRAAIGYILIDEVVWRNTIWYLPLNILVNTICLGKETRYVTESTSPASVKLESDK